MKNFRFWLAAIAVLLGSITASAAIFSVGSLYYRSTSSNEVSVYAFTGSGGLIIPDTINYDGVTYNVTSIDEEAFRGNSEITSVFIGDKMRKISDYSFYQCENLENVVIGSDYEESVTNIGKGVFRDCSALTNVTLRNSVKSIGESVFSECYALKEVKIPNTISNIEKHAFYYCEGLTNVIIPNSVTCIESSAFSCCSGLSSIVIGNNVESIGTDAFHGCSQLHTIINTSNYISIVSGSSDFGKIAYYTYGGGKVINAQGGTTINGFVFSENDGTPVLAAYIGEESEVILPEEFNGMNYVIGDYAFFRCFNVESVIIPNSVTNIGNYAFRECSKLENIQLGNNVKNIGEQAFYNCSKLTEITIPNGLVSIGGDAFYGCSSLNAVYINDLSAWCRLEFNTNSYANPLTLAKNLYLEEEVVTNLVIPDNITEIKKYAFNNCSNLTSLKMGNGVTSIETCAFDGCSKLLKIELSDSLKKLGNFVFYGCSSFESIIIPKGVEEIGDNTFYNCFALKNVINFSNLTLVKGATSNGYVGYYADKVVNAPNGAIVGDFVFSTVAQEHKLVGCLGNEMIITLPNSFNGKGYGIVEKMFSGCSELSEVILGDSVTSIGERAFYDCSCLTAINISENSQLMSIGDYAFYDCSSLTAINIPESVTSIGRSAFYGCKALTSVNIPNSLVDMGDNAFGYCTNLTTVHLGDSIADMGRSTFGGCESLVNVNIPQKLTRIEDYVFNNCKALERIIIPENITDIETYAFSGCSNLKTIINFSSLVFTKGSEGYGYVASEASRVINAPNGSMIDGFVFSTIDGMHSLVGYIGDDTDIVLPEDYKGENYLIGDNAFLGCKNVLSVTIPNSVTKIEYGAFKDCSGLTRIAIADNVTHISNDAFSGCSSLKEVHINNLSAWCKIDFNGTSTANPLSLAKNLYLNGELITELNIPEDIIEIKNFSFYNCSSITKVIIGEGVTNIGDDAFTGCSGLTEMVIPDNVVSIGQSAFYKCDGLISVKLPTNITEISSNAFSFCSKLIDITIPESVTIIGGSAFRGCSSLDTLIVPSSVKSIKDYAFYGCSNLKNVINLSTLSFSRGSENNGYVAYYVSKLINAPNGSIVDNFVFSTVNGQHSLVGYLGENTELTLPKDYKGETYSIGYQAFYGHSAITNITIPNSVTSIGESAFYNCKGLKSINIPSNLTNIGENAFYNCKSLEKVYIDDIMPWCKIDFANSDSNPLYYAGSLYLNDEEVSNIVISDEITEIKDYAFEGCSSLVSVELGNSVTSIGENAFSNCSSLATITIPNSVTNIERFAFSGCSGLIRIAIPEEITEINAGTFKGCAGLTSVVIPNRVDYIGGSAFEGCTGLTSIIIGRKVANFGSDAFLDCINLKYVLNWSSSLYLRLGYDNNGKVAYYAEQILYGDPSMADYLIIGDFLFAMATDGQWTLSKYLGSDTEIVLPESCNGNNYEIGEYSFYKNSALARVKFSEGVTGVDKCAFANCSSLSVIEFSDSLIWIGNSAFSDCSGISRVEIPENVVVIGEHAFSGCSNLVDLVISEGVKTIDHSAFNGCSKLTHIDIPEGVENIGFYAFNGCSSLLSVTISYTVANIGENAFRNCSSLVTVISKIPGVRLFSINDNVFEGIAKDAVLYVSGNDREIYGSTPGWKRFGWSNISRYNYRLSYSIDGEIYSTMYLDFGDEIPVVEIPEKEGYTFSGWSEIPEAMPASDVTISGSFVINNYLLTYVVDGEIVQADSIAYGTAITLPEAPTKEGYTFNGWGEVPATMPAGDVTISGTFIINKYLVTFKIGDEVIVADSLEYGATIVAPEVPEKEGHTFSGWGKVPATMPAEDVTISGTFIINKYLVTFKIGDEVIAADSLEYGATIVAPEAPEKEGHTFNGWGEVAATVSASDVTYEGSYTVNVYNVYYYVGEELVHTEEVAYGEAIPEYIYVPTEEGDVFVGWIGETYETMPAHDVTYTANIESGIEELTIDNSQLTIYDLMGRKVTDTENLKGGIYIVNGRKIVIK